MEVSISEENSPFLRSVKVSFGSEEYIAAKWEKSAIKHLKDKKIIFELLILFSSQDSSKNLLF